MTNSETCLALLGFVPSGYIVCCHHPVRDAGTIFVDGKQFASIPNLESRMKEVSSHE